MEAEHVAGVDVLIFISDELLKLILNHLRLILRFSLIF